MGKQINILTNWSGLAKKKWVSSIDYTIKVVETENMSNIINVLFSALKIVKASKESDVGVFHSVPLIIGISFWELLLHRKNRMPKVIIECLFYKGSSFLDKIITKVKFKLLDKCIKMYIVWAEAEKKDYSDSLGLCKDKIQYVPFFYTLNDYDFDITEGDYIFAGGNSERDYDTLLKAVDGLPYQVVIATALDFSCSRIPSNVRICTVTDAEFRKLLGGCKINIVMMKKGELRSGGQQTFLNSMYMGKPTIVTDMRALCYFENYQDGIAIEPEDPITLRQQIVELYTNDAKYEIISKNAAICARRFTPQKTCATIIELACSLV